MYGFEHRRKFTFRIQVCRRRNADRAHNRRAEIREDVPEEV